MAGSWAGGGPLTRRAVLGGIGAAAALAAVGCGGDDDAGGRAGGPADDGGSGGDGDVIAYGEHRLARGALTRPPGRAAVPVVVLVHGGFWRAGYDRTLMDPLAGACGDEGWAAWNLDYRPVGGGGGWPTTFTDVAAGIDHLATLADDRHLDLDRVVVVGHSAGGTLALWSAARADLPAGAPGADPAVVPAGVVSLAGVTSLAAGWYDQLGDGAVAALMGGSPNERGDDYLLASPTERLPLGVPQLLVHGEDDPLVPPSQSRAYAARAAEEGDEAEAQILPGVDHFDVIDPRTDAWAGAATWIGERFA